MICIFGRRTLWHRPLLLPHTCNILLYDVIFSQLSGLLTLAVYHSVVITKLHDTQCSRKFHIEIDNIHSSNKSFFFIDVIIFHSTFVLFTFFHCSYPVYYIFLNMYHNKQLIIWQYFSIIEWWYNPSANRRVKPLVALNRWSIFFACFFFIIQTYNMISLERNILDILEGKKRTTSSSFLVSNYLLDNENSLKHHSFAVHENWFNH